MVQEKNIVRLGLTIIMFIALLGLVSTPALAKGKGRYNKRACSKTASAAFLACQYEVKDDYWIAQGNCYNLDDYGDRSECFPDAKDEYKEAKSECRDQLEARKDLCDELGEDPYDPQLDPVDFVTINETNANPFFPLVDGNQWVYEGETEEGTETITVTVTGDTKEIEYPAESGRTFECVVVRDVVELDGDVIEDTFDWYAQDTEGNVWYFGEISQEFEDGELVGTEGSWKSGVDGAKPGIIMFADPLPEGVDVGTVYRQEFALGDAEDWAKLESLDAEADVPYPDGDCVVGTGNCRQTEEGTPLEPDVIENKYYKRNIGTVLEENPETGERVELVEFTTTP